MLASMAVPSIIHFKANICIALVVFLLVATLSSCQKKCCDCSTSEIFTKDICNDELPAGFTSWEACREALQEGGCTCD